ncbi:MAG: hypothetical protein ACT4OM_13960 [Actinomycetota bacterium]
MAHIKCCLNSRTWNQNRGTVKITSSSDCYRAIADYTITLYRDGERGNLGTKTYARRKEETKSWTNLPAGTYYFRLQKRTDGISMDLKGKVVYP